MKTLLVLTGIFSLASLVAHGDNPIPLIATESSFSFEDGTRVSMKRAKTGYLDSVEVTVEGKNFKILKSDLGDIHDPRINSVQFTHPLPDRWELTVHYAYGQSWDRMFSAITICFGKSGYIEKRRKIPTGKDTWTIKSQKAGKAEEVEGQEGSLPGIK